MNKHTTTQNDYTKKLRLQKSSTFSTYQVTSIDNNIESKY